MEEKKIYIAVSKDALKNGYPLSYQSENVYSKMFILGYSPSIEVMKEFVEDRKKKLKDISYIRISEVILDKFPNVEMIHRQTGVLLTESEYNYIEEMEEGLTYDVINAATLLTNFFKPYENKRVEKIIKKVNDLVIEVNQGDENGEYTLYDDIDAEKYYKTRMKMFGFR